jgi:tetratricopeptide (TPR) repeat protein
MMAKRWKKQDGTYLKRYASKKTRQELAERFRTDSQTVDKKLQELGLAAKDSVVVKPDPFLKVYERGLKALHGGKWREAKQSFEKVVGQAEQRDLAERARRYLSLVAEKLDSSPVAESSDAFLEAVYERNRGELERALEICGRGGRQGKDERFAYLAASILSATGKLDRSAQLLGVAIELNPKNRVHAFHDSDFDQLRKSPEYRDVFDKP